MSGIIPGSRILVTGMSGLVGTALRGKLAADFELRALNRSDVDGIPTTRASLADFDSIRPAFTDQQAVVHLAAEISDAAGWDSLLATNVIGTRHVFESAAQAGVRRLVFASSGATVAGWELVEPYRSLVSGEARTPPQDLRMIDESMPTRPRNIYASTKVWGEAIARHYADSFGIEVVCLRIGYANKEDRPTAARQFSVWNSQRDVVQAIELALTVELPERFDVFFILSDNLLGYRSIERAKRLLGYTPLDAAETWREQTP